MDGPKQHVHARRKAVGNHGPSDSAHVSITLVRCLIRGRIARSHQPISLMMPPMVAPSLAFSLDTRLSAGWDTTAQNTPAMYPAAKDTPSCSPLLHSLLGLGTTYLYSAWTVFSKHAAHSRGVAPIGFGLTHQALLCRAAVSEYA